MTPAGHRYRRSVVATSQDEWSLDAGASAPLAGDWLVRAAGAGAWRTVADRSLDESGWQATSTPGRWWLDPGLADESAVLYRRRFTLPPDLAAELGSTAESDARWWFAATGLCELGHLWLDGTYLGDLRGRHALHAFEVDRLLRSGPEHLAAVEASHGAVRAPQHADARVRIQRTGPARVERVRALVIEANADRAVLRIAVTIDSAGTHRSEITTTVVPADEGGTGTHASDAIAARTSDDESPSSAPATAPAAASKAVSASKGATLGDGLARSEPILARGRNELEWLVALEQPSLWWPASMGAQALYCITVDVAIDGRSSDTVRLPTGIRTVAIRRGKLTVNGQPHRYRFDALDVVEHELAHRSVYEAADAQGELVCQQITLDPSVFSGAERGLRALAAQAAAAAADHAGHHPCVAAWQPVQVSDARGPAPRPSPWARRITRKAAHTVDPTRVLLHFQRDEQRSHRGTDVIAAAAGASATLRLAGSREERVLPHPERTRQSGPSDRASAD